MGASRKQKQEAITAVNMAIDLFEALQDQLGQDVAEDFKDEILGRKKKAEDSSSSSSGSSDEESSDEEEEEEVVIAGEATDAVAIYSGPSAQEVLDTVKQSALDLIGADDLAAEEPLMDAGLDSLAAVEYGSILQKTFQGVQLPGTLMFDYPNAKEISSFLHESMQSIEQYLTKPTQATTTRIVKKKKDKEKKKKKKRKESSSEEEEEEEIIEEAQDA